MYTTWKWAYNRHCHSVDIDQLAYGDYWSLVLSHRKPFLSTLQLKVNFWTWFVGNSILFILLFQVLPFLYPSQTSMIGFRSMLGHLSKSGPEGGTQYKRPWWACAANMGSKISLLVYEWPLIKCKIWYMNGLIFQNFPKYEPKLAQIYENFGKIEWFWSNFGAKLVWLVYEWVTFSWEIGIIVHLL